MQGLSCNRTSRDPEKRTVDRALSRGEEIIR